MDVDDLFGAFDGEEKVSDVQAAEPCAEDGKRKAGTDKDSEGQPVAKRQSLPVDADAKHELDPVKATDGEGGVELKEGVESSTLREDGTFVKSVRTMHCWKKSSKCNDAGGSTAVDSSPLRMSCAPLPCCVLHTM